LTLHEQLGNFYANNLLFNIISMDCYFTNMSLSTLQKNFFLRNGLLKLESGLSEEIIQNWTSEALKRLNYNISNQKHFLKPIVWMDHHNLLKASQIAPAAWEAICEVVGGEEKIETRTMGIESKHFTHINSFLWSDAFIINFNMGVDEVWSPPKAEGFNWHKDGSYFRHFCDSPEQALLLVVLWNDIEPKEGGTFLAIDSPYIVAKTLLNHPQGIEPGTFNFPSIIRECKEFREITGKAGDLFIIHPYMLHASSQNHSGKPRFMTNPPVVLKKPLRLKRNLKDLSLLEEATLNFLGLDNWDPPDPSFRKSYWWTVN